MLRPPAIERPWIRSIVACACAALLVPSLALAEPGEDRPCAAPLTWEPAWGRFGVPEAILTGASGVTIVAALLIGPRGAPWRGGILVDDATRSALRLSGEEHRRFARDLSDVLLTVSASYPIMVDALAVAAWYRGSPVVAVEIVLLDLETLLFTEAIRATINVLTSRERPYGRLCGSDLSDRNRDCETDGRFYSFFSGHASTAFASASLTCMHHAHLPLYGGGAADTVPCVAGFAVAGATSALRVMGDQHYLSDVLLGAVVGTSTGLLFPWLLRYRHRTEASSRGATVRIVPAPFGVTAFGMF